MLISQKASSSHETVFIEHYEQLLKWALQLADHDPGLAKEVVHDAFIQFSYARPDLRMVENLDAYLYGMLRNIYISQLRRGSHGRIQQLSIIEYDSAAIGLRVMDPDGRIQARDQLRRVCRYACLRKESSKAGSILILRFFHGYYPNEIAQIICGSRQAVDERLRVARSEAKLYLESPGRLAFMKENPAAEQGRTRCNRPADDLLIELRRTIFQSCNGECLSKEQIRAIYRRDEAAAPDCRTLSHIVSCRQCLEEINDLLGLPPLSERYPTDMLGPDTPRWRQPAVITALAVAVLTIALIATRLWTPAASAAELLRRFFENAFERRPVATVTPAASQRAPATQDAPKDPHQEATESGKVNARTDSSRSIPVSQPVAIASQELEVEVSYLLNQIKADLGEQISLTRTPKDRLSLEALVETEERKQEVLRALAPYIDHPAVDIEVRTVAEALRHRKQTPGVTATRDFEVMKGAIPADSESRRYFTERPGRSGQIDEEIDRFANRMMNRSRQMLLHASALARLARRFPPQAVSALKPEAQAQLRSMIDDHAEGCRREAAGLRRELQPIFFPVEPPDAPADEGDKTDDTDPVQAAERLRQLSFALDETMRSAFSISTESRTGPSIKSPQSWRSLKAAEMLAKTVQSRYQK